MDLTMSMICEYQAEGEKHDCITISGIYEEMCQSCQTKFRLHHSQCQNCEQWKGIDEVIHITIYQANKPKRAEDYCNELCMAIYYYQKHYSFF